MESAIQVIWEDSSILILNKPSGVHSSSLPTKMEEFSVAAWLINSYSWANSSSPKIEDGGLVNRLDCETSGILIAAKTLSVWEALHRLILEGGVKKSYLALVEGNVSKTIECSLPIGSPSRSGSKVKVYARKTRTKDRALPAHTTIEPISFNSVTGFSIVRAHAPTGRRHQVRAHAAFLGHPLVGDTTYGSTKGLPVAQGIEGPKFLLHAENLEFKHPVSSKKVAVVAPTPKYWTALA